MENTGRSHPLIVMLHGFGNDKHVWESTTDEGDGADTRNWNNRWFARHGYYVLSYTARGFTDDGPSEEHEPPTPSDPNVGRPGQPARDPPPEEPRLGDPRHPVARRARCRDLPRRRPEPHSGHRRLVRRDRELAPGEPADLDLPALARRRPSGAEPPGRRREVPVHRHCVRARPERARRRPWARRPLRVLAGTPGRRPGRRQPDRRGEGELRDRAVRARPDEGRVREGPVDRRALRVHLRRLRGTGQHRVVEDAHRRRRPDGPRGPDHPPDPARAHGVQGAYYQDEGWEQQVDGRKVAVFSIQGWTDDLFPSVESFRMFKLLKRMDPRWPVEVALGDVGHSRAQNKPETWKPLNARAFRWLESHIDGSHEQRTTVSSESTECGPESRRAGGRPDARGPRERHLSLRYPSGSTVSPLGAADPNGPATDAIAGPEVQPGEQCRHSEGPAVGRLHGVLGAAQGPGDLRGHRPCPGAVCVDRRGHGEPRRATLRLGPGRDRAAHHARRLPPGERPAQRRAARPAVREPLAATAGSQDPARSHPGRLADLPAEQRAELAAVPAAA